MGTGEGSGSLPPKQPHLDCLIHCSDVEHCPKEMDTGEGSGSLPPKRPCMDCLIHYSDEETDSRLVLPQTIDSWKTLLRARQHVPILDMAKVLPEGKSQQCSTTESVAVFS